MRMVAALAKAFGAFVLLGTIKRPAFSRTDTEFGRRALLFWILLLPLAAVALLLLLLQEVLRRKRSKAEPERI